MINYLGTRFSRMLLTLWVIATAVFLATRMTGNPIDFLMPEGLDAQSRAEMIAYFGLDKPLLSQYVSFWKSLMEGEFGLGLMERRSVAVIFGERVWRSVSLLSATLAVTVGVGVLAILFLLAFSFSLQWLPSAGSETLSHYVMPVAALSAFFVASLVRYTRSAMLDVMQQDYMRTARAKGLSESTVILRHGLRNALIPVITVIGLQMTTLVSGAVVIETVFAWNGIGDLLVGATLRRDYPVLQFGVLMVACAVVTINLLVDLIYSAVDPRVRLSGASV